MSIVNKGDNFTALEKSKLRNVKDELCDVADKAVHQARDAMHMAGDELSHARDAVTSEIRSNPVRSSLIALGAGFVLAHLLRR